MSIILQLRYLIILVAALVCLILGLLLLKGPHVNSEFLGHLANEVGYALLIALALAISIEAASRRELDASVKTMISDIGENVFRAVLRRRLTHEILDEVETSILRSDFIRFDHNAIFVLEVIEAKKPAAAPEAEAKDAVHPPSRLMAIDVTTNYRVQNVSYGDRDYPINISIDNPIHPMFADMIGIDSVSIDGVALNPNDAEIQNTESYRRFKYVRRAVKPRQFIEIQSKFRIIKLLNDYELWTSAIPSDGMTLTIHLPHEVKHWDALSIHRHELRKTISGRTGLLEIKHVVLPCQGIVIWWRCSDQ